MIWYDRTLLKEDGKLHFKTAKLLMKGLEESIAINAEKRNVPTEHSRYAMKRRILQIRQELLLLAKSMDGDTWKEV